MRSSCLRLLILLFVQLAAGSVASAQNADPQARNAEWKSYKLPEAEFSRFLGTSKIVTFRAPASWEQAAGYLQFKGPHESELRLIVETVPDGIPLKSYTNAVLQGLRNIPGGADSLTVRTTEISGPRSARVLFQGSRPAR
jgi:hypothetical protein